MKITMLTAISPVDGRYRSKVNELAVYFSEYALIKYRVFIEIEYFIALVNIPLPQLSQFDKSAFEGLRSLYNNFTSEEAQIVKDFEKQTNHDVKAVEYYLKEKFDQLNIGAYKEFIHFGLTSQDINNTAVPYSMKLAVNEVYLPILEQVINKLEKLIIEWRNITMLAHTHGQPASPTKLGKEISVFAERLKIQREQLITIPYAAKFGGANGNFNAHLVAYPQIDWAAFGNKFVNDVLKLNRSQITTQIEHYDNLAAQLDAMKRINNILINLDRDMWTYISMEYFKQRITKGETGSSTMPHKVNPIDFENSEGNLGIANALFEHFAAKLPISRLQRDLTDSTVTRNIGVPIAHSILSFKSLLSGLDKLIVNIEAINRDLENNWSVVSEGIQTILRREGYPNPYEALKELTRTNQRITSEAIHEFIQGLNVSDKIKEELNNITPHSYTGIY
jgi:adenylosuccinate lyase